MRRKILKGKEAVMQDENRIKGGEKRQARQEKRRRTREQIREDLSLPDAKEKEERKGFFQGVSSRSRRTPPPMRRSGTG